MKGQSFGERGPRRRENTERKGLKRTECNWVETHGTRLTVSLVPTLVYLTLTTSVRLDKLSITWLTHMVKGSRRNCLVVIDPPNFVLFQEVSRPLRKIYFRKRPNQGRPPTLPLRQPTEGGSKTTNDRNELNICEVETKLVVYRKRGTHRHRFRRRRIFIWSVT